jgi:hypothetical protein
MVSSGFLQEPHGVTTQKTPFFIVTAVKTSNLTSSSSDDPLTIISEGNIENGTWNMDRGSPGDMKIVSHQKISALPPPSRLCKC